MAALAKGRGRLLQVYHHPQAVEEAWTPQEVSGLLGRVEALVERERLHAVGWLCYEAGPGFDPALPWRDPGPWPLAWFALFPPPITREIPSGLPYRPVTWEPEWEAAHYSRAVQRVRELLEAGETYQVNLTYRLRTRWTADPWALFGHLLRQQPSPYAAFVEAGPWAICSASPELFFRRAGSLVLSQPMKGTAPRGRWLEEDLAIAQRLQGSPKERAENVMIVDMVRNDLARVCRPGTVQVSRLCDLERHPTLWQMISSVQGLSSAPLAKLFAALFPAASITGAPKIRTAAIIRELEPSPRRVYTGAIGVIQPGGRVRFNVAIRTTLIHRERGEAEYGVGGGIVWDSLDQAEWKETLLKARILAAPQPAFALVETMRATARGVPLWEWHWRRLESSARYWDYPLDRQAIENERDAHLRQIVVPSVLRLELWPGGERRWQVLPLPNTPRPYLLVWAQQPIDPHDRWCYHKTTRRERLIAEEERAVRLGAHDAVLWTPEGWVTETTRANLLVRSQGKWLTPDRDCGVLPGVFRARLLARGWVREARLSREELQEAEAIVLANAVRGLWRAAFLGKD
ncbi:MAG: aminodeoxychorismate synthase component I [Thermochromatium sp.]